MVLSGERGSGRRGSRSSWRCRGGSLGCTVLSGRSSQAEHSYLPFSRRSATISPGKTSSVSLPASARQQRSWRSSFPSSRWARLPPSRATQASRSCASSRRLSRCSIAAEDHELLLAVEDVHRADASTRELLDHLARRLAGLGALVLITYRSDELHRSHPFPPCNRGHSGLGRPRLPHRRAPSPRGRRA